MVKKKQTPFSCTNMNLMNEIAKAVPSASVVVNKIYDEKCIKKMKYADLTKKECANALPVIKTWWKKGTSEEKRRNVPVNFMDAVEKTVRCGLE